MAMTPEQINADLDRAFSLFAAKKRRAMLILGSRLAVLRKEAELARLPGEEFDKMARHHLEVASARMNSDANFDHPVTAIGDGSI